LGWCPPLRERRRVRALFATARLLFGLTSYRQRRAECQAHSEVVSSMSLGGMSMSLLDRIVIDPEICHGKPTLRGLRYPVEMILELLSSGMTTEGILADYEDLEREDVLAALEFALKLSQVKRVVPLVA